ncbi:hypothetical protein [Legionella sp. 16cNR16C]|uniref:hypothetical protein n=1 Tax=Legionella sp. 16cNR16C TaxID=2905656 RepID=UPI001E4B3F32|nr:hypothetical protein [Legionella sp. 16cNR16C]MCE3043780.1 hypothetical protein [Legionella sp. 16cNR16C]
MKKLILSLGLSLLPVCNIVFADTDNQVGVDNPFGSNVIIFDPSMPASEINNRILQIYNQQNNPANSYSVDFSDNRYAFIFMPGKYGTASSPVDVRVGVYTSVVGAGQKPDDVVITGAVRTQDRPNLGGVTTVFWRSMENLAIIPTLGSLTDGSIPKNQNVWAVSQASPARRIHVMGDLRLNDVSWSSGGLLADSRVDGTIYSGTQQQYLTRNTQFKAWNGSNWNMVFVGITPGSQIPAGNWPNPPYSIIDKVPLIKEKPYLVFDKLTNQFALNVRTRRKNVSGTDWHIAGKNLPISSFYMVKPGDSAASINAALRQGSNLFITPGVYHLTETINVTRKNTIIYGMGYPTFVSDTGKPIMNVSDVEGVQLAGFMIDGGPVSAPVLLQVGASANNTTHVDPVFIDDVYCRVGGPNNYKSTAGSCMVINSNDVVIDNTWLWRADHGSNVGWTQNAGDYGIIINGNNVKTYNLMSEHFEKYNVVWNGNGGIMYEFQSEPAYDVPSQQEWMDGNINGYAVYKVGSNVTTHTAIGFGVYTNFKNAIWMDSAILAPKVPGVNLSHIIGFWLGANGNSGYRHSVNNDGCGVSQNSRLCHYSKWQ